MKTSQPAPIRYCVVEVRDPAPHRLNDLRPWLPKSSAHNKAHNVASSPALPHLTHLADSPASHPANNDPRCSSGHVLHRLGSDLATDLAPRTAPYEAEFPAISLVVSPDQGIFMYVDHRLDLHVDTYLDARSYCTTGSHGITCLLWCRVIVSSNSLIHVCGIALIYIFAWLGGSICNRIVTCVRVSGASWVCVSISCGTVGHMPMQIHGPRGAHASDLVDASA
ncbi:Uncharacterised protein [Mycobacteroides abscessus subsp. abscessus]|nr:Uncharacterised protein [Mycobacteroides abscessus subsp. abscessus]